MPHNMQATTLAGRPLGEADREHVCAHADPGQGPYPGLGTCNHSNNTETTLENILALYNTATLPFHATFSSSWPMIFPPHPYFYDVTWLQNFATMLAVLSSGLLGSVKLRLTHLNSR